MLKRSVLWLLFATHAHAQSLDYPSIWQCDRYKPNWYCDVENNKPRANRNGNRSKQTQIQTAEQLRQALKRLEDRAVMNPTDQNMKAYLSLWQVAQQKGALFADTWRRVVWQTPSLDYTQQRPSNNAAIKVFDETRIQNEEKQLKNLSKMHGLIFFFRSDCRYCHAMAATLKMLSEKYGIDVLGVSIDGHGLPEFPNFRDGRNQAAAWGIERVPALFIGSKQTGERAPIGFGMMALSEIVHRIFVLTGTKPGENF